MAVTETISGKPEGRSSRAAPVDPVVGTTIGGEFAIEAQLGSGGMGAVYAAKQSVTGRKVAVKVLHRHLIDRTVVDRFEQEAQIASKLNHPNIVTVYKYGEKDDGGLFIAMEYAEGKGLGELISCGALKDLPRALPLMMQMADALAYAHEQKIIHRDIKPGNIVVGKVGRKEVVKVLDFGIAKIMDDNHIVTKTGMLCGSPEYMSPEQWRQYRDIDGRSDIYSLGCVFYAMLSGRPPFESASVPGYMMKHVGEEAPSLGFRMPQLVRFPRLMSVIERCMAKEREDRFPDAYALVDALREVEDELRRSADQPTAVSPRAPAHTAQAGVAAAGVGIAEGPTQVGLASPDTGHDTQGSPLSFLDDLNFDGDVGDDADRPEALGQLRRKHSKTQMAPADEFDIDVTHTGPEGWMHRALLAVGAVQLAFLAGSFTYLTLNPPSSSTAFADEERDRGARTADEGEMP